MGTLLESSYFLGTCLHTMSDDDQTRPQHTTQTHIKHHHNGGGAANPSGGVDLMNPHRLRGGRPCACSFQGLHQSELIDLIKGDVSKNTHLICPPQWTHPVGVPIQKPS